MKKILAGAMTIITLGTTNPSLADSNTQVEINNGKNEISSVLEEKTVLVHQNEISEFEKYFQEDILIEYREDPKYFWEYFGYVSDPEVKKETFVEDVLGKLLDNKDLADLFDQLDSKFGEDSYKSYYDYLFLVSLEETWNMKNPLFQMNNSNNYFTLTGDLLGYFISIGFSIVGNIDSYNTFTFNKGKDGSIEIVSMAPGGIEVIGMLDSKKIDIIKGKAYSIMNSVLEYNSKLEQ